MQLKIFDNSILQEIILLKLSCEKLETPEKGTPINIHVTFELALDKVISNKNYTLLMSIIIDCETSNTTMKLFNLFYKVRATYETENIEKVNEESIGEEIKLFFNQLFLLSRDDINNLLNKMNVKFQMPFNAPDNVEVKTKDRPKKENKGKN